MKSPASGLLIGLLLHFLVVRSESISWEIKPIFPNARKVVHLNDRFIAGGFEGEIMQSYDAAEWSGSFTGRRAWVTDFVFAGGKYYALQRQDLLISTNLTNWERLPNKFTDAIALLHRDGLFLAAGMRIWHSTNATDWTMLAFRPRSSIESLAYNNGTYVGVGFGTIITSTNGLEWREVSRTGGYEVAYGNGRFVAVGNGIHVSTNGVDWTRQTGLREAYSVGFGRERFVIATGNGTIFTSGDATTWDAAPRVTENLLHSVAYGNDRFVVVGWGPVLVSQNGTNFSRTFSSPLGTRGIAKGNGTLVMSSAVPEGGRPDEWTNQAALFVSTNNGLSWSFRQAPWTESIRALKHLNGKFVAVGESITAVSDDANQWSIARPESEMWQTVAFGGGKYVIGEGFSSTPTVATSPEGTNWVVTSTTLPAPITDIVYAADRFVAVGGGLTLRNGFAARSANGIDWEIGVQGLTNRLLNVAYGNGRFVAVGQNGSILLSLDGLSWGQQPRLTTNHLTAVHFAAGLFVAAANAGIHIWTSSDGSRWIAHETGFDQSYSDIGFLDGRFYLTGMNHWLVRSEPVVPRVELANQGADFALKVYERPETQSEVQTSTDLVSWSPLNTSLQFQDDGSAVVTLPREGTVRFIRVLSSSIIPRP